MKNIPNMPATDTTWMTFAPLMLRERKIRSGMSGVLAVASRTTNAASRASGMTAEVIAPPMPWTKRAATSISWLWARPHASEASVKTPRPARKTPRREMRSPSRPASSSRPPKAMRYGSA